MDQANLKKLMADADAQGSAKIMDGVYLNSRENIISDQKEWDDKDEAKGHDFTTAPYWINTDDGHVEAIHDAADLAAFVA